MQSGYRKAAQPRVKSGKQGLYRDMLPRKARSIEEPSCTADALCRTPPTRAIASAWHFNARQRRERYIFGIANAAFTLTQYRLRYLTFVNAACHGVRHEQIYLMIVAVLLSHFVQALVT